MHKTDSEEPIKCGLRRIGDPLLCRKLECNQWSRYPYLTVCPLLPSNEEPHQRTLKTGCSANIAENKKINCSVGSMAGGKVGCKISVRDEFDNSKKGFLTLPVTLLHLSWVESFRLHSRCSAIGRIECTLRTSPGVQSDWHEAGLRLARHESYLRRCRVYFCAILYSGAACKKRDKGNEGLSLSHSLLSASWTSYSTTFMILARSSLRKRCFRIRSFIQLMMSGPLPVRFRNCICVLSQDR